MRRCEETMAASRDKRDGTWRYRTVMKLPDGSKLRISGTPEINTKEAAKEAERADIERRLRDFYAPPKKEVILFKEFVEKRWTPTYPLSVGNRETTIREKEIHTRVHLVPAFGSLTLDKIHGEVVDKFFARLREQKSKPKTVKNIRATLRRILASAVEWGLLTAVPPLPKVKVPEPPFDFFTQEESDLLVSKARTDDERALLLLAVHTGARAGEQIAFQWGDIDWHSRKVIFRRSSTRNIVGATKSGRERKVPLTGTLEKALKAVKHLRGPLVFCNQDGSPMSLWQLHERLWGTCRRAGLRIIKWHELRHSFASQLAMRGVPLRQIQEWMGHATITMTMRYSHLTPGGGEDLIKALEAPRSREAWQQRDNKSGGTPGTDVPPTG